MGLKWIDDFVTYGGDGQPIIPGVWRGRLPTIEAGAGRNGKVGLRWHNNQMARSFNGSSFIMSAVLKLENSPIVVPLRADRRAMVFNTLTPRNWIFGCSWFGFAYCGLIAANDGSVHFTIGSAFDNGPNSQDLGILKSSASGVLPLNKWALIEWKVVIGEMGSLECRINGKTVLEMHDVYNKPLGDFCVYVLKLPPCPSESQFLWPEDITEVHMGGPTRGTKFTGDSLGWTGYVDAVWGFDTNGSYGDFVGDLQVETLVPTADGTVSESAISGTSPAPTRWQSVDDALTPDNEVTSVLFDDATPKVDEYDLAPLVAVDPIVYGVHALSIARRGPYGTASARLSLTDGVDTVDGGLMKVQSSTMRSQGQGFPLAPNGLDWTADDVNALKLRFKREA